MINLRYAALSPSPGERTVLGVARAAVHKDLDVHSLAVIVYRDTQVDYPFRRAIWNLAVKQLANMPHPTLGTLIFVAESPIRSSYIASVVLAFGWLLTVNGCCVVMVTMI